MKSLTVRRTLSFVLCIAMLLCLLPPFSVSVQAADRTFHAGEIAIITPIDFNDGDTVVIEQGVFAVYVDSVDVNLIFGKYNAGGANQGVKIDRSAYSGASNQNANAYYGTLETGRTTYEALFEAGQKLASIDSGWRYDNDNQYYIPTAPFLVTGDANVTALFYGTCEFRAGANGIYIQKNTSGRYNGTYTVNRRSGNTWRNGGYAGIQVDAEASLTIANADELYAYGAYQNTGGHPSTNNGVNTGGASDQGSAGGAGIGGGVSYNTISSAVHPNGNGAAYPSGYVHGTPGDSTILNGHISAQGGHLAAGIGGGHNSAATTGSIKLLGGNITAQGGQYAAGIGEGDSHASYVSNIFTESEYEIVIGEANSMRSLNVVAKGGYCAAGIGTTDELSRNKVKQSGLSIEIFSGNITATSGLGDRASAAIGAGDETDMKGNHITIHAGATISAASFSQYAINNHGVLEDDLPIVNLDPDAYMFLARFTAYNDGDRNFILRPIVHNEKGHAVLVTATLEQVKNGQIPANARYYAYDRENDFYYAVDPQNGYAPVGGVITEAENLTENLSYCFSTDESQSKTYTVPAKYKAVALTLPDPSIYGGAYVLEVPNHKNASNEAGGGTTTYSVIEKYGAGVTSGQVVREANYHITLQNGEATDTPNMRVDATAMPLDFIRVGTEHDHEHQTIRPDQNMIHNFAPSKYGYTVYVPSDTSRFFLSFSYQAEQGNDNTQSIAVDVKETILVAGDITIVRKEDNTIEGVEHHANYLLNPGTEYVYQLQFRDDQDHAEIWIRKSDHALVGTPTYIVYRVKVVRKPMYAVEADAPSKVYDGKPAEVDVLAMMDEPQGIVERYTSIPTTISSESLSAEEQAAWDQTENEVTWVSNRVLQIRLHGELHEDEENPTETYYVTVKARRFVDSPILYIQTTIQCAGHPVDSSDGSSDSQQMTYHIREVGTEISMITGRIRHYGDTHSTFGHASIDVGALGAVPGGGNEGKGEAFVQMICHGEEYLIWHLDLNVKNGTGGLNDNAYTAERNALLQNAKDYWQMMGSSAYEYHETGNYVKGIYDIDTEMFLRSPYLSMGQLGGDGMLTFHAEFAAAQCTVYANYTYTARMSNGGTRYTIPSDADISVTYYANPKANDFFDPDSMISLGSVAPRDAGKYYVQVHMYAEAYEGECVIPFEIRKAELVVEGIRNWLTYLKQEDIEALQQAGASATLDIADAGEIYFGGVIAGDTVALNASTAFFYNSVEIGYAEDKITVRLPQGMTWLPEDAAPSNKNYTLSNVITLDGEYMTFRVQGELAYKVDRSVFRMAQTVMKWRKFWPTWSETPLLWDGYDAFGVATAPDPTDDRIDYHSPDNITHQNLVTLRTVNRGADETRYSVDIEVGSLHFVYSREIWDVNNYQYVEMPTSVWSGNDGVNNAITITNHSNASLTYTIAVTLDVFYGEGIEAFISDAYDEPLTDSLDGQRQNGELDWDWKNVIPLAEAPRYSVTKYLFLDGVPQNPAPLGANGTGSVTVTIAPVLRAP